MLPRGIRRAFRLAIRRRDLLEKEIDEEVAFHLQQRIDALVARGLSPADAAAEARRRFGNEKLVRPALQAAAHSREQELSMHELLDALRTDVRFAVRQLMRAPAFTLGATCALALGIGANATMFNVLDRLFRRPPPHVRAPKEIYTFRFPSPRRAEATSATSYPAFATLRANLTEFSSVSMQTFVNPLPLGRGTSARLAESAFVDGAYFHTLGVQPVAGRFFVDDDARLPDGNPVAVIGYRLWQGAFNTDASIVGREIVIGTERVTIVGVAPEGFNGVGSKPIDVWLPITHAGTHMFVGAKWATEANSIWLFMFGRLKPGATLPQATAHASAIHHAAELARDGDKGASVSFRSILPGSGRLSPDAKVAALLGVVSLLVLFIACSNVTNLILARSVRRRREIGVRLTLGVTRSRLARQLVVEAMLVAALGAIGAFVVAALGSALMRAVLLEGYAWAGPILDWRTIGFTTGVAAGVGLCLGLLPMLQFRRMDLARAVGEGRQAGGVHRTRVISALVMTQAMLSIVLLVGATLFVRSLQNVHAVPLGLDIDHSVVISLDRSTLSLPRPRVEALFTELRQRARTLPGVEGVAIVDAIPLDWTMGTSISVPGRPRNAPEHEKGGNQSGATAGYFATIGTRLLQGREFTDAEERAGAPVAVISEPLATMVWPDGSAVGKCVRLGADSMPCLRIVGVAEHVHRSGIEDSRELPHVYYPLRRSTLPLDSRVLLVRTVQPYARVSAALRSIIDQIDPTLAYADIWVMRSRLDPEIRPWRLGAIMFGAFGVLAIALAALGLYSVIAYSVAQRTQEMGIRVALGARVADIVSLVVRQGALLATAGSAAGVAAAVTLAPHIQPLLFGVSARSLGVYLGVTLGMLIVAVAACLIPAWRAGRVNPMLVLRSD